MTREGNLVSVLAQWRPSPVPIPLAGVVDLCRGLDPAGVRVLRDGLEVEDTTLSAVMLTGVTHDSRLVMFGDLYAALRGFVMHGADFVPEARRAGATAVLTDIAGLARANQSGLPVIVTRDPRALLGAVSAYVYGNPSVSMTVIGITGTNGKTTMAHLIDSALIHQGVRTGLIGTVGSHVAELSVDAVRTTPEAPDVQSLLALMKERGVRAVAMEVSSHALALGRVDGTKFRVAVFTGLTQDHLDFHHTMEDYFTAKTDLFTGLRSEVGVVCVDDEWGRRLAREAPIDMTTYSIESAADWHVRSMSFEDSGATHAEIVGPGGVSVPIRVTMPGLFNVSNAVGALVALVSAGYDVGAVAEGLSEVRGVAGRMQRVDAGQSFTVVVDYAHTPDAVSRVLTALRTGARGRLWVVLGCGGDRDSAKRPLMGAVASELADAVVITDDNPRSEDPAAIRHDMIEGVASVPREMRAPTIEIGDRHDAIAYALTAAREGDVVAVLGKGHEIGQEVRGVITDFDDLTTVAEILAEIASGGAP